MLCVSACRGSGGTPAVPPDGAAVFQMACARCHGAEGGGDGPQSAVLASITPPGKPPVPDLRAAHLGTRYDRAALEHLLQDGRGNMPAHRARLGPADLAAVADYVESHFAGRTPPPGPRSGLPGTSEGAP